jgi:hypothetical protein
MYHRHDPTGSPGDRAIVLDIIDGRPWTASKIRQNNLRQHCRILGRTFRISHPAVNRIRPAARRLIDLVMSRSRILQRSHPLDAAYVPSLLRLASYFHRWRRAPESWWPNVESSSSEQWHSLLAHLFPSKHPIPSLLESAWFAPGPLRHPGRDLYCAAAAGRSLKREKAIPQSISKRALHFAQEAPQGLTFQQSLRYGQVRALGGTEVFWGQVSRSRMVTDFRRDAMWIPLMEKVIAQHRSQETDFEIIADLMIEEIETKSWEQVEGLLKEPFPSLRHRALIYWERLFERLRADGIVFRHPDVRHPSTRRRILNLVRQKWEPMENTSKFEIVTYRRAIWEVHQLTDLRQLIDEGLAMKHCVSLYNNRCSRGFSAIFSFRIRLKTGIACPAFTLEVAPQSRRIRQIRNRWNGAVSMNSVPVIEAWAAARGINR